MVLYGTFLTDNEFDSFSYFARLKEFLITYQNLSEFQQTSQFGIVSIMR